ncbi:class I SAM-dependent methyltransferase [Saccharopolyspora rosea]|uniref:Class I SAM-dependent methyltransferase n=2 Tax=Saccharopolyspora rosea TaxID=524884 RepID=A0ABW3FJH3_9PSEU
MADRIPLTGAQEQLLVPLHARALDSRSPRPVLGDRTAVRALRRIDSRRPRASAWTRTLVTLRARLLDEWSADFLAEHPHAVVLHLGCGLDSRSDRIPLPEGVDWYDVDQPDVIALRRELLPEPPPRHTVAASVADPALLDPIPGDRPVLVEGLVMYLSEEDGLELFRRITAHFPSGELLFDAFSTAGVRLSNRANPAVVTSGARLGWSIDDPHDLEGAVPGLRLVAETPFTGKSEVDDQPWPTRLLLGAMTRVRPLRRLSRLLHYRF